ncbi:2-hydroxy-3-oxopropionate reductase [uncultured delta proteobacterium]|uniref:2-hydroxy-3-oxopropionate reductase n=1 Tax=uncultured delta proteobacterium TaxID=34034 RepID=A0A212KES7_9DELT|nr:2-hydroxy-3-oxopropionate reductase [uncultured delta proteobacterium]
MHTIGFIGLGIMGRPMAKNLIAATGGLLVHDLNGAAVADLVARGATAASPAAMAARCDVIFLILPSGPVVESVLFGANGLAGKLKPGTIVCDMSTNELAETRSFAERLTAMGVDFIDAPVSGGEPKAVSGELAIMAGGETRCYEAVLPYLKAMGGEVNLVGGHGSGCAAKIINQILVHVTMAAVCEAYALAEKLGVDIATVYKAVGAGSASSAMLHNRTGKILKRDFSPGAKVSIVHKDIKNVLAAGQDADMPLPLTGMVFDLLKAAKAAHFQDDDVTRLLTIYERLGGIAEQ